MNNFATLIPESKFFDLFPHGQVPIINILIPNQVVLERSIETECYMIDLEKLGDERLSEIARRLAAELGENPQQVFAEIRDRGLPLRRSQVASVSTDIPFFL